MLSAAFDLVPCVRTRVCTCVCVYILGVPVRLISLYWCACLPVCLTVLCACLPVCLTSVYRCAGLPVCLTSVYRCSCPPVCLTSVYRCACLPVCHVQSMEAKKRGDYQQAAAYGITAKRYNVIAVLTGTIVLAVTTIFTGIWFYVFLGHDRD